MIALGIAGTAFNVQRVKLDYKARADIPIFMAARGDNAVKACGELADGMIVSNMCSAGFVARPFRIEETTALVPGNVDQQPEVVLGGQVDEPSRRHVIDTQKVRS